MKILMVNSTYYPQEYGGAERMVKRLADALLDLGHEVVVACTASRKDRSVENVNGVKVYRLPLRNVYPLFPVERRITWLKPAWHLMDSANVLMERELKRIVGHEQPDVAHTHNLTGLSVLAWRPLAASDIPVVHTLHDFYVLCPRSTMYRGGRNCGRRHLSCAMLAWPRVKLTSHVAAVVGVSRFVLDRHLEAGAFRATPRVTVIPNATTEADPVLRAESADGPLRFGYLGWIAEPKGVETLLEAVMALRNDSWTLEIAGVGNGSFSDGLRRRFADPRIRFAGMVDATAFLARIDVLVVPSRLNETFGMVIVEAYRSGAPVVASRRGGMPEIVEEGRTGYLFDPGSPTELTAILQRLIGDRMAVERMRDDCRAAAARFSPRHIAAQYEGVYREVARERSAGARKSR